MSSLWYALSIVAVVLLLAALFLYLLRQEKQRSDDANSTMAQAVALKMDLMTKAQAQNEDLLEVAREQFRQQAQENQAFLREILATSTKALEQANLISMNGSQASTSSMAKLLASSVAMLGTKDTLAYHQVQSSAFPSEEPGTSYTAVDDAEMQRLQEVQALANQQLDADDIAAMLERMGVTDGSAGFS